MPSRDGRGRGSFALSTHDRGGEGPHLAAEADRIGFQGSSWPERAMISYLYLSPALAPGTKISQ